MVTDRLSSALFFTILAMLYESKYMWWFVLLALDIGAHWLQMASTYAAGLIDHKTADSSNIFISIYYSNRYFLAFIVACQEWNSLYYYIYSDRWASYKPDCCITAYAIQLISYGWIVALVGTIYKAFINLA